MKTPRILYCGDSELGGAANYLLACLRAGGFRVTHLGPGRRLTAAVLRVRYQAIIFSDYGSDRVAPALQRRIRRLVEAGCGFMMVGGWGSFSGPFGRWRNTEIESLLPVRCLARDDRRNFPSGLVINRDANHAEIFKKLSLTAATPVICGLNELTVRPGGHVLLSGRKVRIRGGRLRAEPRRYPLLVISKTPGRRTAAFATDFAPHWCGGLVDWGLPRRTLGVNSKIRVEVGSHYVRLIVNLVRWLAGA